MSRGGASAPALVALLVGALVCGLGACEPADVPLDILPARLTPPPDPASLPAVTLAAHDPGYVGAEACAACHAERVEQVRKTSHFQSSGPVTAATLRAPVGAGAGVPSVGALRIDVQDRDGELWQLAVDEARDERLSRRMDVVIGSGKIAQTFLTWEKDRLYQLPATWFAKVGWRFSPGYREDRADFSRPVYAQCLECHALWAEPGRPELVHDNAFVGTIEWGVTCEKCHGPGREHVAWARAHPQAVHGEKILVPSDLPRARRDDICLLCHARRGDDVQPVFTFRPGDALREHYAAPAEAAKGDLLHSFDQGDRLHESKCFKESGSMSCITCHNPHRLERGDDEAFSMRCLACHEASTLPKRPNAAAHSGTTPCLDCHMPRRGTEAELRNGKHEPRAQMRDHRIGIY